MMSLGFETVCVAHAFSSCVVLMSSTKVLEAWFGKAKVLVESGFSLEPRSDVRQAPPSRSTKHDSQRHLADVDGDSGATETKRSLVGQALYDVMDLAMAALMHPSRMISSMAPVLLEHVVSLRQVL